jgi:hypothetical protein
MLAKLDSRELFEKLIPALFAQNPVDSEVLYLYTASPEVLPWYGMLPLHVIFAVRRRVRPITGGW